MTAVDAGRAFGSELRLRLIRHYLDHPGSQADAARALAVNGPAIARNTAVLIETGVVVVSLSEARQRVYAIDRKRLDQLRAGLDAYLE